MFQIDIKLTYSYYVEEIVGISNTFLIARKLSHVLGGARRQL